MSGWIQAAMQQNTIPIDMYTSKYLINQMQFWQADKTKNYVPRFGALIVAVGKFSLPNIKFAQ